MNSQRFQAGSTHFSSSSQCCTTTIRGRSTARRLLRRWDEHQKAASVTLDGSLFMIEPVEIPAQNVRSVVVRDGEAGRSPAAEVVELGKEEAEYSDGFANGGIVRGCPPASRLDRETTCTFSGSPPRRGAARVVNGDR